MSWLNPKFKLYAIKEFQSLKKDEGLRNNEELDLARILAKINYSIYTDALKNCLLPSIKITRDRGWLVCAIEADILNYALLGRTAEQWCEEHHEKVPRKTIYEILQ